MKSSVVTICSELKAGAAGLAELVPIHDPDQWIAKTWARESTFATTPTSNIIIASFQPSYSALSEFENLHSSKQFCIWGIAMTLFLVFRF